MGIQAWETMEGMLARWLVLNITFFCVRSSCASRYWLRREAVVESNDDMLMSMLVQAVVGD